MAKLMKQYAPTNTDKAPVAAEIKADTKRLQALGITVEQLGNNRLVITGYPEGIKNAVLVAMNPGSSRVAFGTPETVRLVERLTRMGFRVYERMP